MNTGDYYPLYLKWNKIVSKYVHPHSHLKNPEKEKEKRNRIDNKLDYNA